MTQALVMVDVQNDFMPGGALPTRGGDEVVAPANRLQERFDLVIATQDWHPADHGSFASQHPGKKPGEVIALDGLEQVLWPDHCVQGSAGAELHPRLERARIGHVIRKGTDRRIDSYSAFFDNGHRKATGLEALLRERGVSEVWLLGLATDYCVLWSARDAVELGFRVRLVEDACRGVELEPGDIARAVDEMRALGVEIVTTDEVLQATS